MPASDTQKHRNVSAESIACLTALSDTCSCIEQVWVLVCWMRWSNLELKSLSRSKKIFKHKLKFFSVHFLRYNSSIMRFSIRFFATQLLPQTSCLCLVFVYLFCLPVQISVLFGNPKQISDWAACEWSLYSHSVMKANTSPGSSASFVPVALSHEFNPAISIDFYSFNLETPITAPQSTF